MTERVIFSQDPLVDLSFGVVDIYTETKSTRQEIRLMPKETPIVVTFESANKSK